MELGVSEAAQRLGISRQRVLTLVSSGSLPARWVGGHWLLDSADLALREQNRPAGRPMGSRVAWGLVVLAEGHNPSWLRADERSRLRGRLRHGPSLEQFAEWVRARSTVWWLRGHPATLPRLLAAPGAIPAGASAPGHDIIDVGRVEVYLHASRVSEVARGLALRETARHAANAIIKMPQGVWPFGEEGPGPVAVAVDLWETGDERSQRSARQLYEHALAAHRHQAADLNLS